MNLNRKNIPNFKSIENIDIPIPEKIKLDNGIEAFIIKSGTQDVIKLDLAFNAGSWYQNKRLVATAVNEMLIEGTKNFTSQQIAEKLDYYGAFIHANPTKDFGNITLYTLKKYFPETLKILDDIIKNPIFPENELKTFLNKKKQQFLIELEKVNDLARREFNEQLFGKDHPYGEKVQITDYDNINQDDLLSFYSKYYQPENCKIILSGKVDEEIIELLNQQLGNTGWINKQKPTTLNYNIPEKSKTESIVEKKNATQSALRVGKIIINKDHPDYLKLNIVNTILGGFFGSRLMKTIREEKGYTYGISSVLISLKKTGYFVILSEVGADVAKNALSDILNEVKKLRTELVSNDELTLVKNYMLGDLLRSFDGPFEISSSYRSIIDFNLDYNYFNQNIEAIKNITPNEIKDLANKYLHEDTLIKTIAGKY